MKSRILVLFVLCWAFFVPHAFAQVQPALQSLTITTATVDSVPISTIGVHSIAVDLRFGTVSGSYGACTMQAKTSLNGTNYLTIGNPISITVSSSGVQSFTIVEPLDSAVSATASQSFGRLTKFTFACSSYGTSISTTALTQVLNYGGVSDLAIVAAALFNLTNDVAAIRAAAESSVPVPTNDRAATSGGYLPGRWESDNSSVSKVIKDSPGQLGPWVLSNEHTAPVYLRFYNATSADCGSATNLVWGPIKLPFGPSSNVGGLSLPTPIGLEFSVGIVACITAGDGDTNTTAINTGLVNLSYGYK